MSETTTGNGQLYAALAKAAFEADAVEKGSKNDFHRYKYASAESIYAEARGALHKHGLSLVPVSSVLGGTAEAGYLVGLTYMLGHSSGESMKLERTWPVVPDRGRPLDKALAAALTTALAYLVRDLLLLPRVDEEVDKREDGDRHEPRQAPKRGPAREREQPENAARVNDDTPPDDQPSGPPPGAEEEDLAEQLALLLPKVHESTRKLVADSFKAALEAKSLERMRKVVARAKQVVAEAAKA